MRRPSRQARPAAGDAVSTVADRLHSAAVRLLRSLRSVDAATGLSGPRASALSVVVFRGPLPIGALAEAEQVRPPTMTRLVAGMERLGLLQRTRDAEDGRVQMISATAKGRAVLQAGRRRRVEMLASAIASLPARDRRMLDRAADLMMRLALECRVPKTAD